MDTDGNRPNVADVISMEAAGQPGQPIDTRPMWRAGMRRVFFSAGVAALGVLASSVIVGVCWLWHSISTIKAEHAELAAAEQRQADLRRKLEAEGALTEGEFRELHRLRTGVPRAL